MAPWNSERAETKFFFFLSDLAMLMSLVSGVFLSHHTWLAPYATRTQFLWLTLLVLIVTPPIQNYKLLCIFLVDSICYVP